MLGLNGQTWHKQKIGELTTNADLLTLFTPDSPKTREILLADGRTMWAKITELPDMGQVAVLRDVSPYKELDRMKRNFVTAFTHDLRTPLATVKGYIELVRMDGPVTTRQQEDLVGIARAANSMKAMVEDLLELSKLEQLEQLPIEIVKVEDIVQPSVGYMRPLAKSKEITLLVQDTTQGTTIEGNVVLLVRAISNLLDNAIKYTPRGGKVTITSSCNNDQAQIAVTDNGPGISAKDLPRVFEKFYRARAEVDEDVPGTGLGLSIVKTIVEHHHGKVWVESQPQVGSTFTITLLIISAL